MVQSTASTTLAATPTPTPIPVVSLYAKSDSIIAGASQEANDNLIADVVLDTLGGDIQCAMPRMFITDERVIRSCARSSALIVSGAFVGIWCLFFMYCYDSHFATIGVWTMRGIWLVVGLAAYAAYEASVWSQIFDWRRSQLFQARLLEDSTAATRMYPWAVWRDTQVSEVTTSTAICTAALIMCTIFAMAVATAQQRAAWFESARGTVVGMGTRITSGVSLPGKNK